MSELYKNIETLCRIEKITITEMCRRANVPRANLTELKMGRQQTLGLPALEKIAAYFNVSVGALTGNEKTPEAKKTPGVSDEVMELAKLIESLTNDQRQMLRVQVQALAQSQKVPGVPSKSPKSQSSQISKSAPPFGDD